MGDWVDEVADPDGKIVETFVTVVLDIVVPFELPVGGVIETWLENVDELVVLLIVAVKDDIDVCEVELKGPLELGTENSVPLLASVFEDTTIVGDVKVDVVLVMTELEAGLEGVAGCCVLESEDSYFVKLLVTVLFMYTVLTDT